MGERDAQRKAPVPNEDEEDVEGDVDAEGDVVECPKKAHQGRDGRRAATDTGAWTTTSCGWRPRETPELDVLPHRVHEDIDVSFSQVRCAILGRSSSCATQL